MTYALSGRLGASHVGDRILVKDLDVGETVLATIRGGPVTVDGWTYLEAECIDGRMIRLEIGGESEL